VSTNRHLHKAIELADMADAKLASLQTKKLSSEQWHLELENIQAYIALASLHAQIGLLKK
jgi:hypothetical protein